MILEDVREPGEYGPAGCLTGRAGVCLGMYRVPADNGVPSDLSARITNPADFKGLEGQLDGDGDKELDFTNPLILSDKGDYLWGIQCYFSATEDLVDIPVDFWLKIPHAYREMLKRSYESARTAVQ